MKSLPVEHGPEPKEGQTEPAHTTESEPPEAEEEIRFHGIIELGI